MDRLSDYNYHLPDALIAQTPLQDRAASRLFVLPRDGSDFQHRSFREVPDLLREGDLLVLNDTRVTALRLMGHKPSGGEVEALLLHELAPGRFTALMRPGRRLKAGAVVEFGSLRASVVEELSEGRRLIKFDSHPNLNEELRAYGSVPLPPYITERLDDAERYQTVIASKPGSAAAPTAALHFTNEIFAELARRGVTTTTVTLSVGIDTFRPVQVENLNEHVMHGESCEVTEATAEAVARCKGRVIAVGTTSVRTLETFAKGKRQLETGSRRSELFIRPGFNWQVVDGMFTNFHLPKTTMLVMLSALVGRDRVMAAYEEAVREQYRFLSFGDSMLIL